MKKYKYILRKGSKKDICPQCGKRRFVPFVLSDDPSVLAGAEFGRCDREQSCGYFRYPYGEQRKSDDKHEPVVLPPILFPAELTQQENPSVSNTLFQAYAKRVGAGRLRDAMAMYRVGNGGRGEAVFYQFDGEHVRTAKAIRYDATGHRAKDGLPVRWLHKLPTFKAFTKGKELRQCLFGAHLLKGLKGELVYVVESEKTAVLMAAVTGRLFVACGGSQMLKGACDLTPLIGQDVFLIPDEGQFWNWRKTAARFGWDIIDIAAHPLCEAGNDIWDIYEKGGQIEGV